MAEKYEEKRVYYIPAFVERIEALGSYPVKVSFSIGEERCAVQFEALPDLMFTAEEVVKENNLDTLLRDEVVKENRKLKAKVKTAEEAVGTLKTKADAMTVTADSLQEENEELRAENEKLKADRDEWKKVAANNASFHRDACNERDELKTANDDLKAMVNDLKDRLARFEKKNENQAEKIKGLEERISDVCAGNQQLRENRDALNNEAAVHMTSIHNLQVAVEVLAEKIFEMRCEQDG